MRGTAGHPAPMRAAQPGSEPFSAVGSAALLPICSPAPIAAGSKTVKSGTPVDQGMRGWQAWPAFVGRHHETGEAAVRDAMITRSMDPAAASWQEAANGSYTHRGGAPGRGLV